MASSIGSEDLKVLLAIVAKIDQAHGRDATLRFLRSDGAELPAVQLSQAELDLVRGGGLKLPPVNDDRSADG